MSFLRNSFPHFMTQAASSQLQRFQGTPVRQDSVWPSDPVASWVYALYDTFSSLASMQLQIILAKVLFWLRLRLLPG